jgi:MarR family transcriptional regulator, transcriptional regulator for hemolysin
MATIDRETIGLLLHGAARAWRNKLDKRLRPLGLSQAKWRTLSHLAQNDGKLTQSDLAERIGVEEPTLVGLLHRLEKEGWVKRRSASHDRRCKTVHLQRRSNAVLHQIFEAAHEFRHELVANIPERDLQVCMRVLARIRARAEEAAGSIENGRRSARGKVLCK